jgi:hypothetical protein
MVMAERNAFAGTPVAALPATVTLWPNTHFARFAPQLGASEAKQLGSAAVVAPSGCNITQKIIGRGWRSAGSPLRRFLRFWRGAYQFAILVAPGFSSAAERVAGGFCAGRASGAGGAGARFANGDVPPVLLRIIAVRRGPPLPRPQRNELGQMERRSSPPPWPGVAPPRHVPPPRKYFRNVD